MAPASDDVRVLEVCRVAPANISPATATLKSLQLTFLDVTWLDFSPTQRLLFYGISDPSPTAFSDFVLPKLKRSLALALSLYLPLTGTLTWPPNSDEPFLQINNDAGGVSVTVAESSADFDLVSGYGIRDATESHPRTPKLRATEAEALALQVTAFGGRGFSIGIAMHHAVLDGKSFTTFLKAWASICRRLGEGDGDAAVDLPPEMMPVFDRAVIRDPDGFKKLIMDTRISTKSVPTQSKSLKMTESEQESRGGKIRLRGTYVLSRADIEKLRDSVDPWVRQNREQLSGVRISTFVLTCAYTWACMVKAGEFAGETDPTGHFGLAADDRARIDPPVPANYFGNCLGGCAASAEFSDLAGDHGVAIAAAALSEAIKKMKEVKFSDKVKMWVAAVNNFKKSRMVSVAGSPLFGVYGADFGWGKPLRVEIVSVEDTGAIGLTESREGDGGVEVGLVLHEDKMAAFAAAFREGLDGVSGVIKE